MGNMVINPLPFFSDLSGQPLNGGKIYIGVANANPVTNPVSVYQDSAMTIPMMQPLRTTQGTFSLNGTPLPVYISSASYSILVLDKSGRTVWSQPDVESPSALTTELGASGGSALVGFEQPNAGAILQTVQSKLQQFVDVMDFGADATGTIDSTTAFLNAFATGKLVRGCGKFLLSGILLEPGWAFQGVSRASTQLFLKNGANQHIFYGTNVNDIVLKDFYADGNKANQAIGSANPWRGVYLSGQCARIRLDNIQVDQCQDHGISLNDTSDTPSLSGTDSVIINSAATNCGSAAHSAAGGPGGTGIGGGADSLLIVGCLGQSNYLNGFKSPSGNYTNCLALQNGGGFETGFATPTEYGIKLTACRAINNSGSGFRHQGQGQWIEMDSCSAVGNAYSGIDVLGGVNGLIVRGGYYLNNGTNGTRVTGTAGLDGISIHGEAATDPQNIQISGARFFDNQGTPTQQYALYATAAATNIMFDGSNLVGTHAAGDVYLDPVASSNNIQIGNFMGSSALATVRSSVSSNGTGTTTLATMTIPANRLVTGSTLRIKAAGRVTGTAGTKLIRLGINGTTVIFSNQSAGQQNPWVLDATLPIGANSSRTLNVNAPTASQTAVTFSTTSGTLTIAVNCTPAGGDIVTLDAFEVSVE